MMTDDQNANSIIKDTEEKMVGKSFEVHASEIVFANAVSFGGVSCFLEKGSQLIVELVRKLWSTDIFVVIDYSRDVRRDLPMKLQTHQSRRPWTRESNSVREIALAGSA